MLRRLALATAFASTASMAHSETDLGALIADGGLSHAQQVLSARPMRSPSEEFALGGVQFLRTIEVALQELHTVEVDPWLPLVLDLPFLRLARPSAEVTRPMSADLFEVTLTEAIENLSLCLETLKGISPEGDIAVWLDPSDVWFDINANGQRDLGESFVSIVASQLGIRGDDLAELAPIRFDRPDVAWLTAYAHLLSGASEVILALDPTEALPRVLASRAQIGTLNKGELDPGRYYGADIWVDVFAAAIHMIDGPVDGARLQAARDHFLTTIAENRVFWTTVDQETDNEAEWIPNDRQQSALPVEFPPGAGAMWMGVLTDAEAVLRGDLLLPHWRLSPRLGINAAKFIEAAPDIDLIAVIQGEAVLPFVETGHRITTRNWRAFEALARGNGPLFMVMLN